MLFREAPMDFTLSMKRLVAFVNMKGIFYYSLDKMVKEKVIVGPPAGKIDSAGLTRDVTVLREIEEETGWRLVKDNLSYMITVFIRYPYHDFFHIYRALLKSRDGLRIQPKEHKSHRWIKPADALALELVKDFPACIRICYEV